MRLARLSAADNGYRLIRDIKCQAPRVFRFAIRRIVPQALPKTTKGEGVPTATVFPCPPDLKTDLFEKASNALVCELVTIFGVNGFLWHKVKVKVRVLDVYMLLLRALEVHLDPRLIGIPKRAMTEASGIKVSS
jgi:hypothetical protein